MPKVSEEYKKNRRSQIIDVARECFIKHGYQKTSMNEIIAATGLSAGAIYNHFGSKNDIMLEAARLDLAPFTRVRADKPWDYVLGCLRLLDATKTRRFLLATWGEAVSSPIFPPSSRNSSPTCAIWHLTATVNGAHVN